MRVFGWVLTQRTGVPVRGRHTEWALTEEVACEDTVGFPPCSANTTGWLQTWGLPAEEKMGWEKEMAERECKANCRS